MIPYSLKPRQYLGVMNLTPNSFSDGGELNQAPSIQTRIQLWQSHQALLDWGAMSTAPQNATAQNQDEDSEWGRLQMLLPFLSEQSALSIDTFRPRLMQKLLPQAHEGQSWIWNDVSGQLDDQAIEVLKAYPHMSYILCHNLVPSRERTPWHKDYTLVGEDFFVHMLTWFSQKIEHYQQLGLKNPLYLDPCFGFSKNYLQNWELIERFEEFSSTFIDFPLVIGVSRKSFVRERFLSDHPEHQTLDRAQLNPLLDHYQEKWHVWLDQVIQQPCFFRVHQPPLKE